MTMETGSHRQAEVDWACIDTAGGGGADDDEYPHAVVSRIKQGTRKRLYEHGEFELDREMDKMYKRDYWEDPAYASLLELAGLGLARADAVLCLTHRRRRATDAMLAEWRQQERERRGKADEPEREPEPARTAAAAGGYDGRLLCFWRSIVDSLTALIHYFLG